MMRPINPPGPSLPGFSPAVLIPAGSLLLISGQVALGPDGVVGNDLATQLEQVFQNLQATLRAAGAEFHHVARMTIYIRDYDPAMLPVIRAVRARYINPECPPASTLIGVAALASPEFLVEIEAIASLES